MICVGILVAYCFTTDATSPPTDSLCLTTAPIYWSAKDTRRSKEQIDRHNRVYEAVCLKKR